MVASVHPSVCMSVWARKDGIVGCKSRNMVTGGCKSTVHPLVRQAQDVIFLLLWSGRYWYLHLPSTSKSPMKHNSGTLLKNHRVFISKGVQNGWVFSSRSIFNLINNLIILVIKIIQNIEHSTTTRIQMFLFFSFIITLLSIF